MKSQTYKIVNRLNKCEVKTSVNKIIIKKNDLRTTKMYSRIKVVLSSAIALLKINVLYSKTGS